MVHDEVADGELAEYYRERASEYDAVYRKPERQRDLAVLKELLPRLTHHRHVLEVAAGTGYWTEVIATTAASITATDLTAETLAVAATRDYSQTEMRLLTADAYRLDDVPGEFDFVFCGFWWSHVPRTRISRFMAGLSSRVPARTQLVLLDNRYVPGSNHPITRTGPDGDTYQTRKLRNGCEYEVLKNFPDRDQLTADLDPWANGLRYTALEYYWLATCVLRGEVTGGEVTGKPLPE